MVSPRKSDPSGKKVSKLYVEPAELARKLIKELEGTKASQGGQTWVRDQYTVFLCREDFARFRSHLDQLVSKLESHMERHVQNRRYATPGAITVELTMDPDLKPGYFGVLAERAEMDSVGPRVGVRESQGRSIWDVPGDIDYDDDYKEDYVPERPGYGAPPVPSRQAPPLPGPFVPGVPAVGGGAPPLPGTPLVPLAPPRMPEQPPVTPPAMPPRVAQQPPAMPPAVPPAMPPAVPPVAPAFQTPPAQTPVAAAPVAPAAEPLVLKVNGQERVFPQGKAVVGRSRDADLQIDSGDVSRRHAVIYWSEGSIVVKDLGSTNGTMVNGYPVDSTVVRPSDVIRIGNAHITAAPK